jgi:hypothetical protein
MYGKISVPVFEVVEWVGMDGKSDARQQKPKHRQKKRTARRRRG